MQRNHVVFLLAAVLQGTLAGADHPPETGLIVPSAAELRAFEEKYALPVLPSGAPLPSRVVNSTYLPPVADGNQGQLGICGSICITYFTATHQLAKARGWTAPGHDGNWSRVTSPAWGVWCYSHNTKNGQPWGANPLVTIEEIIRAGIRSWQDYPYTGAALDVTYMPTYGERAAALRWRAETAVAIGDIHSPSGIRSLKYFLAQGNIAATSTPYVDTLVNFNGPHVGANGVVVATGDASNPGHALTIVGYDDSIPYTDPRTGAARQGAFLLVNSWGAGWGYTVPEAGTGGFIWIPYELPFLSGAYSLTFPAADAVPALYAEYAVVDRDGSWISSAVTNARWYNICSFETAGRDRDLIDPPVVNGYSQVTNRYTRVVDAGDFFDPGFPAITLSILSSAASNSPEGEAEFSLHDLPDDLAPALVDARIPIWGQFPFSRKVTISPFNERASDLGIDVKYGGIAAADLDGDGAEEFVAGYREGTAAGGVDAGAARFVLARNDGAGTYTLEPLPGDGARCGQPLLVDIDNDGDLDVVHASREQTDLLLNNGSGMFSLSTNTLPAGGMGGGAAVADFNGDGRPDLLLANMDEGLLLMRQLPDGGFEKRALGRFTPNPVIALGVDTTCVAAGDVNGDGRPDFVFWQAMPEGGNAMRLVLGINEGDEAFSYRILPTPDRLLSVAFALGDFDQDGCDDLAWSGCSYPEGSFLYRTANFGVLRGSVDGWMRAVPIAPDLPPICGGGVVWADVNNDGALDLIMTGRESDSSLTAPTLEDADKGYYRNHFYVLHYANGYFIESGFNLTGVTGSPRGGLLAPIDVDGDGDLDLFSSGYRGPMRTSGGSDIHADLYFSALYLNTFDSFAITRTTNALPTAPTSWSATPGTNRVRFAWSGARDAETAEAGLRYHLQVGTTPGGCDVLSRTLDPRNPGLLQRDAVVVHDVPAGTLHWRVRTLDATAGRSPWSDEQTVTMPTALTRARVRIARAEGGASSPEPGEHLVAPGGTLQLSAEPAAGWQFDRWSIGGASVTNSPHTLSPAQAWLDVAPHFSPKASTTPGVGAWSRQIAPYDLWYTFGFVDYAAVALNGHLYCFPGYGNSSQTWRTSDGQTWQRNDFMGQAWFTLPYADAVVHGGNIWLVADATVYSATQAGDGSLSWTTRTTTAPWGATHMELTSFGGTLWAISGYQSGSAGSVWSSADGVNWTEASAAPWPNHPYKRLVVANGKLLAIVSASAFGSTPGAVWATSDGVTWTQQCAATPWEHDGSSWLSACYIAAAWFDGAIHVVGMENTHFVSTDDGVSWVKVHPTGSESSHFTPTSAYGCELVAFDGDLYLMGSEEDDVDWLGGVFWRLDAGAGGGATTYTLNLSVCGDGGSTMPPAGVWFDEAGSYPLEARPAPGYAFVSWTGPVAEPLSPVTSVNLLSNLVVAATFQAMGNNVALPQPVPLSAAVFPDGCGRVERVGAPGQDATQALQDGSTEVIALAATGWAFSHWIGEAAVDTLTARTKVAPAGAASVALTACFRPARTGTVLARGNTSGFIDGNGRQWLWGQNRFGITDAMWNSPDGGLPAFSFPDVDFHAGVPDLYALGADGSLRLSGSLRFLEHRFVQLAPGTAYTLAIDGGGRAWSWGSNAYGQLGDGTQTDRDTPTPVLLPESETFVQVCAGDTYAMALSLSGKVYAWGANSYGQTGPTGLANLTPLELSGLPPVLHIAAGTGHALALGADGRVYGWGANTFGQATGRRGDDVDAPTAVAALTVDMATHALTMHSRDLHGNPLGDGAGSIQPPGLHVVRAYAEFFVEARDGTRYRFDHWRGPVVDPGAPDSTAKAMPNAEVTAVFALTTDALPQLHVSMNHDGAALIAPATGTTVHAPGAAIELATQPYAGWQFDHWIIDGATNLNATVPLVMTRDIAAMAHYSTRTFRTRPVPGLLNSWGQPAYYDAANRSIVDPDYAGPLFIDAAPASYNGYTKLYLGADGTVWYVNRVPDAMERVPGETADIPHFNGVTQIVSGYGGFMLAVRQDGSVWVWGQVPGHADFLERPIHAAGLDAGDWQQIVAANGTLLFLHNNGTVSSWGLDTRLTGTGVAHTNLTQIPGLSGVAQLAANPFTLMVRKTDGTVWGWGDNSEALLGVTWATLNASDVPVRIPGLSGIASLFPGGFARDSLGRIWVWGNDAGGNKGLGTAYANQSILPPMLHPSFPDNAACVTRFGITHVLCEDGAIWRAGNAQYWTFTRLNTEYLIDDTYATTPVYRTLQVDVDPAGANWISHGPGVHRYMENDRVLLWADTPLTYRCDGWRLDGVLVSNRAVSVTMDRDHLAEPVFSLRPKIELPAPELRVGSATVDLNTQGQVVRIPITLAGQDYVIPDALQFTMHVPGELPRPQLTQPAAWRGQVDIVTTTETAGPQEGWHLKVLMLGTNNLFAVSHMPLMTLSMDLAGVSTGNYPLSIVDATTVMRPVAAAEGGAIAVPLNTHAGMLQLKTSERCEIRLHPTTEPTAVNCLTDSAMDALAAWGSLRQDRSRYAEVWLRCGDNEALHAFSYDLAIAGPASFADHRQGFINEEDLHAVVAPDGKSLTGMGGPIADEKIVSHNDFATAPYRPGDWLLVARMPLDGSNGTHTIALTNVTVALFEADGVQDFILPDQRLDLTVAPNEAPTSADMSVSTTSDAFVRIRPEIHDVNPQDRNDIAMQLVRHPTHGRVLVDPADPHGFIYHPPENGIFSGTVAFQFMLTDGTAASGPYTVEIVVNNPPRFVGLPDVIPCGADTNVLLGIQVVDADTPAGQLAFTLHRAPHWMSISNRADGSAVILGAVPPTRDTWQVFAVQVADPLSRTTVQATLLLTFDPAQGGVLLTVIQGMGGGLFEAGAVRQISARDPATEERFAGWDGDIEYLDDAWSLTPIVTLPNRDITLTARFDVLYPPGGFTAWADTCGLAAGQNGPGDCPMGDGVSNLEKYALGWDPLAACDPGDVFHARLDGNRIVIEYEKHKSAAGVSIAVIWCTTLNNPVWRTDLIHVTLDGETATHEQWTTSVPLPADAPLFVRLRFSTP